MDLKIERLKNNEILVFENATNEDILPGTEFFRNFSGLEKRSKSTGQVVNSAGRRNFCIGLKLPTEALDELADLGVDIVELASDEEYNDEPLRFVRVQITDSGNNPSKIFLMNDEKMTKQEIHDKKINLLDRSRFAKAELYVRTWHKENGKVSLYLNDAFFWIQQDAVEQKFANYDEVLANEFEGGEKEELPFD